MRSEALALSAAMTFFPQSTEACAAVEILLPHALEVGKIINAAQRQIDKCTGSARQTCVESIILETERALERNPLTRDCRIWGVHPLQVECVMRNIQRFRKVPRKQ